MWIKQVFLGFIGLASGSAISAGVFSFIISVGVVPRIIGKSRTAADVIAYENAVILGGTLGNLFSLFSISVPLGIWIVVLFGLSAGIFTGCLAVALAEILNTFPIMFRRFGIKEGLSWLLFFMALGKAVGALYFYANHMQQII
ncbi:MAG: stage V sporulation protein AB [Lachnospiraceae bacterium]|nr:stage V sporulation protein AB [Lachnospiraceae bacterium]